MDTNRKKMMYRAQKVWEVFKNELIQNGLKDSGDVKEALATSLREVAQRLYTDLPELGDPSVVIEEIADELDELQIDNDLEGQ
jgi:hypothetical protein